MLKKTIIIPFIFAAAVMLNGCDSGTYSAEKRFWHASKVFNQLLKAPDKATPVDYQKIIDSFREITIRYPMWPNSGQAQFNIGQLYAMQGNFSKARDEFMVILKDYAANTDLCARSLFAAALVYEREDNWPKAKETFDRLEKDYTDTGTAFQVPLHVAEYYKVKGKNAEADAAYLVALDKYKKMIKDRPKTYGALLTIDLVVNCYTDQEKWNEAVDYLGGLVNDYPDTLLAPKAKLIQAAIYEQKLNQLEKSRELYDEIIKNYSKTPFAKTAQQQVERLNKPK
ncbi:MAG: tetratricopeptide repeat protein [Candidatus Omnitrophica bacterium]|nr:tetratricopeptide repeat protein [Candidatus Omnitrophota bacterium]MDD5310154.1 tetratricopeptide repeat protein [Candidatus Omnitrophota bacterium]MDD5546269.1 tetratricopeptide repeat protein [Candidatus Omnitrophota bacterium]